MRISKIIVAFLVSVVAVTAMTGVAVADPESVIPDSYYNDINVDGTPITVQLTITGFDSSWSPGQLHTISASTTDADGAGGTLNDLQYRFTSGASISGWLTTGTTWQWTDSAATEVVTVDVKAVGTPPVGIDYDILIVDSWATQSGGTDIGACTIFADAIPEFATIAIPAIAVLGLFLFFNKRKHKKD